MQNLTEDVNWQIERGVNEVGDNVIENEKDLHNESKTCLRNLCYGKHLEEYQHLKRAVYVSETEHLKRAVYLRGVWH